MKYPNNCRTCGDWFEYIEDWHHLRLEAGDKSRVRDIIENVGNSTNDILTALQIYFLPLYRDVSSRVRESEEAYKELVRLEARILERDAP